METRRSTRPVSLKRYLSPKKEAVRVLRELLDSVEGSVAVYDENDELLLGDATPAGAPEGSPIVVGGDHFGTVVGSATIAGLIAYMIEREIERRELGAELLDTYREINLLYALSEHLSQSLEVEVVAMAALEEARELLSASDGGVLLFDEQTTKLKTAAQFGSHYDERMLVAPGEGLIGEVFTAGKGQVVNAEQSTNSHDGSERAVVCAPLMSKGESIGVLVVSSEATFYTAADLKRLNTIAAQAGPAIDNSLLYARQVDLTEGYSRFVPPEFLRFLGKDSIVDVQLGDYVSKDMAIMVSDIRGFTTLSENMTPQENFQFINQFLAGVSPIIRQSNGFIVKYMGDGIMALFPGGVDDAIGAALATVKHVKRSSSDGEDVGIGIGLNTGTMMVGTVGETKRMQGDIFSDAVNLTARLEGLTREFDTDIVISEQALASARASDTYDVRLLGEAKVKGRQEPLQVYEIQTGSQESVQ